MRSLQPATNHRILTTLVQPIIHFLIRNDSSLFVCMRVCVCFFLLHDSSSRTAMIGSMQCFSLYMYFDCYILFFFFHGTSATTTTKEEKKPEREARWISHTLTEWLTFIRWWKLRKYLLILFAYVNSRKRKRNQTLARILLALFSMIVDVESKSET